eukprot:17642_1
MVQKGRKYFAAEKSCTSVTEDNTTCYINSKPSENTTYICGSVHSNCVINLVDQIHAAIHCPTDNCVNCTVIAHPHNTDITILGYSCELLYIQLLPESAIVLSNIYAPANGGSLIIGGDSPYLFSNNRIYSSIHETGTKHILIHSVHNTNHLFVAEANFIDGTYATGHVNLTCNEEQYCSRTRIICGKQCNIDCLSLLGCDGVNVFSMNGTSNVNWYCNVASAKSCKRSSLSCGNLENPNNSSLIWDSYNGWYYAASNCVFPTDSFILPPLSCAFTTEDRCIITKSNDEHSRDVICDPKYEHCEIHTTVSIKEYEITNWELICSNSESGKCISCRIYCDDLNSCSGATIIGNNCALLEINIKSIQQNITIYAPGNGQLQVSTHSTDYSSFFNNRIYSVVDTKNMIFNFGTCDICMNNLINGSYVTEYMNLSCNEYAVCAESTVICPNDASCNIDCTSQIWYNCEWLDVFAIEGTHDVNWKCHDHYDWICGNATLYCKEDFSQSSKMEYINGTWKLENTTNGCVNIPTIYPTLSPTIPTINPTQSTNTPTYSPSSATIIREIFGMNKIELTASVSSFVIVILIVMGIICYYMYWKKKK